VRVVAFLTCGVVAGASIAAGPLDAVALYREREAISEAISFASEIKLAISEFYIENQRFPKDAAELGSPGSALSAPDRGVASIRVDAGTLVVTLGGDAVRTLHGKVVATSPCLGADAVVPEFVCGYAQCPVDTLVVPEAPQNFRLTTLTNDQLPASCRGQGDRIDYAIGLAKAGNLEASGHWGAALIKGRELPRDVPEGLRILHEAAERGGSFAMALLGDFHAIGVPGHIEVDDVTAYYWFARARDSGGWPGATAAVAELERRMSASEVAEAQARIAAGAARE
jgi:hypothetical protein